MQWHIYMQLHICMHDIPVWAHKYSVFLFANLGRIQILKTWNKGCYVSKNPKYCNQNGCNRLSYLPLIAIDILNVVQKTIPNVLFYYLVCRIVQFNFLYSRFIVYFLVERVATTLVFALFGKCTRILEVPVATGWIFQYHCAGSLFTVSVQFILNDLFANKAHSSGANDGSTRVNKPKNKYSL